MFFNSRYQSEFLHYSFNSWSAKIFFEIVILCFKSRFRADKYKNCNTLYDSLGKLLDYQSKFFSLFFVLCTNKKIIEIFGDTLARMCFFACLNILATEIARDLMTLQRRPLRNFLRSKTFFLILSIFSNIEKFLKFSVIPHTHTRTVCLQHFLWLTFPRTWWYYYVYP